MSPRVWPPFLDWRDQRHWNPAGPDECVLCGRLTPLLSEHGRPSHKTCAEAWFEANPDAWEFYERRRDHEPSTTKTTPTRTPGGGRTTARRRGDDPLTLPDAA